MIKKFHRINIQFVGENRELDLIEFFTNLGRGFETALLNSSRDSQIDLSRLENLTKKFEVDYKVIAWRARKDRDKRIEPVK